MWSSTAALKEPREGLLSFFHTHTLTPLIDNLKNMKEKVKEKHYCLIRNSSKKLDCLMSISPPLCLFSFKIVLPIAT